VLDPAVLLQRLDHALDLLTSGDRDLPLRQRTLRATISWSYSLLDAGEQLLLRRLSSFHEGWTLEAIEQVCYRDAERHRAVDELDSLVEKGLVRVVGSGERYALLETIRAFAAEQLHASGEVAAIRHAHADYYLQFAAAAAASFRTTRQLDAVRSARSDNANTHAAIQWLSACARAGEAAAIEKGLLLCGHLNWFWHIGGQHFTAHALLGTLLSLAADAPPSRGRALARIAAGMASSATAEWERSLVEWTGGYEDGKAIGDEAVTAEGLMGIGYCCLSLGQMKDAGAALDDAMARSAGGVCEFVEGLSTTIKGMLLFVTGSLDAGMKLIEEARRIQERLNDREGGGMALSFLAQMWFAKGDHARALVVYGEALEALMTIGDQPEVARVHCEMGWTALSAGDAARRAGERRRRQPKRDRPRAPGAGGRRSGRRPAGTRRRDRLGCARVERARGRPDRTPDGPGPHEPH
jgi:tetratricopeptide (TPR) repeat protein